MVGYFVSRLAWISRWQKVSPRPPAPALVCCRVATVHRYGYCLDRDLLPFPLRLVSFHRCGGCIAPQRLAFGNARDPIVLGFSLFDRDSDNLRAPQQHRAPAPGARAALRSQMKQTVIIGAGSWGTALAALWGKDGRRISLWGNNAARISRVQSSRENTEYLPGIRLPDNISATHELSDCSEAELIVFVTPSTALREIATRVRNAGSKTMRCC